MSVYQQACEIVRIKQIQIWNEFVNNLKEKPTYHWLDYFINDNDD